ncbi:hypothetical protein IWW50_001124 [Coemansia erecta]|nr:hypothetical protein GGF43_002060 [Coemansia sp. RSA 2618]KAJ2828922.1 hypothetical protein IWW50_001124 [Coemansia erecta]
MNLYCSVEPSQSNTWLPAFQRPSRSALHSRTSSTSTVVDDVHMISPIAAFPMPSPPAPVTSSASLASGLRISLKPAPTAPSSPRHVLAKGGSMTPRLSPRCDSVMDAPSQAEPAKEAEYADQQPANASDECMFDMDSDWSQRTPGHPALDRAALSYGHTGKPQPWAVRRMSQYDSLQAQIRAIDDDDNEFYPS